MPIAEIPFASRISLGPFDYIKKIGDPKPFLRVTSYSCFGCGQAHSSGNCDKLKVASTFGEGNLCSWPVARCGKTVDEISDSGVPVGTAVDLCLIDGPRNPDHNGLILMVEDMDGNAIINYSSSSYNTSETLKYMTLEKTKTSWIVSWGCG